MSMFLRDFPFINDFTVGIIMALGYLTTTISQLGFGYMADHSPTKNRVLGITVVGLASGLLLLLLPSHTSFITLLPGLFLFYVFLVIPGQLAETIVVENIDRTNAAFGTVKCFSSAGAGVMALLMFFISLAVTMEASNTFIIALSCAVMSLVPTFLLPATKGHAYRRKGESKKNTSLRELLKNRRLVVLLLFILCMFIGIQATNVFMGIYYATDAGMNAGLGTYGLFYAICISLETCLMSFGNRIWKNMEIYHLFAMISISACARSFLLFLAPNIYVLQFNAIFHALLFAPMWCRLAPYVNSIVSKEMRATGQAAWYMMAFGIGPMIGSALGGTIADRLGIRNLFLVTGIMLLVVAVVFYFLFKRQRALDEQDSEYLEITEEVGV